ncbi:MAG: hypothetical protein J6M62_02645 [Selenomonadaceae bacterium]|nr:hypothetical protein [Selenomonadaceae bacterium]MBP3723825.1 hypothetical protein [Selenomonadaceae bacterium]
MSRFKFRVWDAQKGIMLFKKEIPNISTRKLFNSKSYTVMQWTGKNSGRGEPIYEGDIIVNAKSKNKEPYIVYWDDNCAEFSSYPVYPATYIPAEINLTKDNLKNIVIVGNVYENPEIARYQKLEDIYAQKERPFKAKKFRSCPFCWSDNVDLENDEGIWFVKCEDCGAQGGNAYRPENAIAMWNNNLKSKGDDR